jgi:hypothetical protein
MGDGCVRSSDPPNMLINGYMRTVVIGDPSETCRFKRYKSGINVSDWLPRSQFSPGQSPLISALFIMGHHRAISAF